jgi:hypothetical protein
VVVGDTNEREGGRMAKGSMWERESLANDKIARGKSGKNPTVYVAR